MVINYFNFNNFQTFMKSNIFVQRFSVIANAKDQLALKQGYENLISSFAQYAQQLQQLVMNPGESILLKFFIQKLSKLDKYFIWFLQNLTKLAYSSKSKIRACIYEIIPDLMILLQNYLSNQQSQQSQNLEGIKGLILSIYNNQCHIARKYNQSLQMNTDKYLRQLLKDNQTVSFPSIDYKQIQQLNFANKSKTFILFLYYYHISARSQDSIVSFLRLIYVYCGGKTSISEFGLYLLNKPNQKTIFVHRVSEQEMEWILLILYYIYINYKHFKFQVIAAVSLLRRKSANESKFRVYEISQSILHLFENEYQEIF